MTKKVHMKSFRLNIDLLVKNPGPFFTTVSTVVLGEIRKPLSVNIENEADMMFNSEKKGKAGNE